MTSKLIDGLGGWRSLVAGFIILSFLGFAGLLAVSGHSPHLFVAVAYLLVAAFVLTRIAPRDLGPGSEKDFDPDAGFRLELDLDEKPAGCDCSGVDMTQGNEVKQ